MSEKKVSKYAGTQTEKNLEAAFAGESQARNKYTYFASVAKKEGYEQMSALFLKTADNEKEHAKLWFKELGELGDTPANLAAAAAAHLFRKGLPRAGRRGRGDRRDRVALVPCGSRRILSAHAGQARRSA